MKTVFIILLLGATLLQASYTKNSGIVTDSETGLMWQDDYDNNLSTTDDIVTSGNGLQALVYCNELDSLGHNDWRLPNVNELVSITDDTKESSPVIDSAFEHTQGNWYWSSTTHTADTTGAWAVGFSYGGVVAFHKSNTYYVRCVRGSVTPLNTSPIARDDSFSTSEDTAVSGNVITEPTADSDPESDPLHVSVWGTPANGTLSATNNDGSFTYTPNLNYSGTDSFQYTLSDDGGLEDNATVTIIVNIDFDSLSYEEKLQHAIDPQFYNSVIAAIALDKDTAISDANQAGYNNGHSIGFSEGNITGYDTGVDTGWESAKVFCRSNPESCDINATIRTVIIPF